VLDLTIRTRHTASLRFGASFFMMISDINIRNMNPQRLAVTASDSGPDINRAKAWAIAHKIDGVVAAPRALKSKQ